VPVANIVKRDKIVEKVTVKEMYVDKVVTREIPVPVERVVTKEVPVYVDKVVDRIVYKEVFVDKVCISARWHAHRLAGHAVHALCCCPCSHPSHYVDICKFSGHHKGSAI
jgi:hypothetical protein